MHLVEDTEHRIPCYETHLFVSVYGTHFQFPETNPCEIIDLDATFSLRYEDESGHSEVCSRFMTQQFKILDTHLVTH